MSNCTYCLEFIQFRERGRTRHTDLYASQSRNGWTNDFRLRKHITSCFAWAHLRKHFTEAITADFLNSLQGSTIVRFCNNLKSCSLYLNAKQLGSSAFLAPHAARYTLIQLNAGLISMDRCPTSRRNTDFQITSSIARAQSWRFVTARRRSDLASNKVIMQIQMSSCNLRCVKYCASWNYVRRVMRT
jgi:hypothetical protein